MIKKEEVRKVAKLARLGIDVKEEEKFQKELSSILGYIDLLNTVDVSGVAPTYHPAESYFNKNVMRKDVSEDSEIADELIEAFPEEVNRYNKVKSVF
ncbi:Asp-tRNA(Asn)/Glu-tRNA(Gln) amidotransferase subunit GatC [Patescibacteria group bacterium]|nr:Asp-tRNA(Asn)/Glu-tRNA(Gln) amidotransferase subunit GatC [Patescibacteria group bacterium]